MQKINSVFFPFTVNPDHLREADIGLLLFVFVCCFSTLLLFPVSSYMGDVKVLHERPYPGKKKPLESGFLPNRDVRPRVYPLPLSESSAEIWLVPWVIYAKKDRC